MKKFILTIRKSEKKDCFNFWVEMQVGDKYFALETDIAGIMKEVGLYEMDTEDTTFCISNEAATQLLDNLLEAGLRPTVKT